MAIKSRHVRILVNEADISGQNNNVSVTVGNDRQDVTTFQATAKEFITLDPEGSIEHSGYFYDDAQMEALLEDIATNDETALVGVGFGTNTAGYPIYVITEAPVSSFNVGGEVSNVVTVAGNWGAGQGMSRARELFTGTLASTGNQTGRDLGAGGSADGVAYLWVTGITGSATDAEITVESDSAATFDSPAATDATFTFSDVGATAIAIEGTIGRYVRVVLGDLGGATNITFVCAVAVNGVTQ